MTNIIRHSELRKEKCLNLYISSCFKKKTESCNKKKASQPKDCEAKIHVPYTKQKGEYTYNTTQKGSQKRSIICPR